MLTCITLLQIIKNYFDTLLILIIGLLYNTLLQFKLFKVNVHFSDPGLPFKYKFFKLYLENNRWFSAVLLCIYGDNHTRVVPYFESCMPPPPLDVRSAHLL